MEPPLPKPDRQALIEAIRRDADAYRAGVLALALLTLWCLLLAIFHFFPSLDVATSAAFFEKTACPDGTAEGVVCGDFPYRLDGLFLFLRKVLFYAPSAAAVVVLIALVMALQHHGATYEPQKVRRYGLSLIAFFLGPYVLVNLLPELFRPPEAARPTYSAATCLSCRPDRSPASATTIARSFPARPPARDG
jgi:hypothetical protein